MRYSAGIDENGLGPVMGPLVVTGVSAETGREPEWFPGVEDSKLFFAGRSARGFRKLEEHALALFAVVRGRPAASPAEFLGAVCGADRCRAGRNVCRERLPETFSWSKPEAVLRTAALFSAWMERESFRVRAVRSRVFCPLEINALIDAGATKGRIDAIGFAAVVGALGPDDTAFAAGKIGGMRSYGAFLRADFPGRDAAVLEESDACSRYRLAGPDGGIFEIAFHRDVEAVSFLAALASIVGKYVREILMHAAVAALDEGRPPVSGYRDPRTAAFIAANRARWAAAGIPEDCLLRRK